ncbi:MAG TPA: DUF2334 domain-containing protein [Pseudomonas sp.]|nr:DUF2334 domain-containing protein [Pseudomonas sp.]
MAEAALTLVLEDGAAETWLEYRPFVEAVDTIGGVPITWLVVPDFHQRNPLERQPEFCRLLDRRAQRGDELVLHGCYHADLEPAPKTPRDWFMRRVYTHEGEFYCLDEQAAGERLAHGLELFRRQQWPLHGFVAPAWLMSEGTRRVLAGSGLTYTSDPGHLYLLPDFTPIVAPGLVWSARSPWRRGVSWLVSERQLRQSRQAPLLRLGLHPVDMRHEFSRRYWLDVLERMLRDGRTPLTKIDWLRQFRQTRAVA